MRDYGKNGQKRGYWGVFGGEVRFLYIMYYIMSKYSTIGIRARKVVILLVFLRETFLSRARRSATPPYFMHFSRNSPTINILQRRFSKINSPKTHNSFKINDSCDTWPCPTKPPTLNYIINVIWLLISKELWNIYK